MLQKVIKSVQYYRTVPYRTVPYGTVRYRTVRYRAVPYGTVRCRTAEGYERNVEDGGGGLEWWGPHVDRIGDLMRRFNAAQCGIMWVHGGPMGVHGRRHGGGCPKSSNMHVHENG